VPDYPFGLKTGVKLDYLGWTCPEKYISIPVDYTDQGRVIIEDPVKYFKEKGTIKEDLNGIQITDKTIMAIHCPPIGINLDVCYHNRRVGSKAVYDWIKRKKPLLVLSGHIHENFEVTEKWFAYIGKTLVIQPGQSENKTNFVVIKIIDDMVEATIAVK
jgi:Icc-related predicted phosphoesterase